MANAKVLSPEPSQESSQEPSQEAAMPENREMPSGFAKLPAEDSISRGEEVHVRENF